MAGSVRVAVLVKPRTLETQRDIAGRNVMKVYGIDLAGAAR